MRCGISTACLFPQRTGQALQRLTGMFSGPLEIFLNTFSELEPQFLRGLKETLDESGCELLSLHPFSSGFEPFLFFSEYEGRFEDGLELYRRYFNACRYLGARLLVLHGDTRHKPGSMELYAERFARLAKVAKEEFGVILAQENVERCRCYNAENIRLLRRYTGDSVRFVLDLKQALRGGQDPFDVLEAMGPQNICHVHLSDNNDRTTCILPGMGEFDFARLFRRLRQGGCEADGVIELYKDGFDGPQQLVRAAEELTRLARSVSEEETV